MSQKVRKSILVAILLVAICALGWEYGVVVPGFNNAQQKLTELADQNIKKTAEDAMTMHDVKQVVSQKPSKSKVIPPTKKKSGNDKTMRAMMFERHDQYNFYHVLPRVESLGIGKDPETITVVYKKLLKSDGELDQDYDSFDDKDWLFIAVHFNEAVPQSAQRSVAKDAVNPGDVPSAPGGGSAPGGKGPGGKGPGGKGPGGKGPGGKGPGAKGPGGKGPGAKGAGGRSPRDPEAIFKENDKDKDGKLTGDEIPEGMSRFADRIDEDKDGSISLAEMKAAMERLSKSGGRGGAPGGRAPGGRGPGGKGPGGKGPGGKGPGGKGARPAADDAGKDKGDNESAKPAKKAPAATESDSKEKDSKPAEKKSEKSN